MAYVVHEKVQNICTEHTIARKVNLMKVFVIYCMFLSTRISHRDEERKKNDSWPTETGYKMEQVDCNVELNSL